MRASPMRWRSPPDNVSPNSPTGVSKSLRQTLDQADQSRLPRKPRHELIGGSIGLGKRDVVPHRAGEQVRLLRHVAFYVAQAVPYSHRG